MFSIRNISVDSKGDSDRELQRLKRQDLLELLIEQLREGERLQAEVEELSGLTDRLKARLDDKDEQIERLTAKLDDKDAQIEHLKGRLDDKDDRIDRLKAKLDDKDERIEAYRNQARVLASQKQLVDMDQLLEAQRAALATYMERLAGQLGDDTEAEEAEEQQGADACNEESGGDE